ncbi:polysaccharide export ATP-binding protein [Mycetohabitans rhizoxinica HKI 454]|uniref:Polysaccharide export ATP-binding protein n=2 Tax=Mycetohabitans rhizoxinica TaxID=412963 RepID=E5ATJ5_MYCRK|nr:MULTISPECIES: ABC transporter ATP-binding protein [Mycetohabitans]MCG1047775.1 ABC transporter ATP-binding protein [Mycetohabitans sp. B6]CBK52861.1 polysaccharide export ATP-binding protein [Mycetohabitans rhizoxinica HKI 454]CBW75869.1 polysaccharide export ATP-binding protein [Mycetohabitans rhizoxinica HKI 454]
MRISLENVTVRFPIYDARARSFKRTVMAAATGGRFVDNNPTKKTIVEALHDISLNIEKGERVALIGGNGAGKTTLLRVLAGVYVPEEGTVVVEGHVTSLLDSMLGMDGESTGYENMYLRGLFLGLTPQKIEALSEEIAEFSELGHFLDMPVRTYSSGMTLRLAFSISTILKPEILLMDEWMSVGDEHFKKKAEERLEKFVGDAGILVIATHDLGLVDRLATRRVILEHGTITSIT